jgi:RNA polymerase sigma-70 factor (ECF subfamily)
MEPGSTSNQREMPTIPNVREGELLRRIARGDEDAFVHVYRAHQASLYRFALRMTGRAEAAEEIVQDVFMVLLREPQRYDASRGPLAAYLFGITRNRVLKHFERAPREVPLEEEGSSNGNGLARYAGSSNGSHAKSPAALAEQGQRAAQVREAVLSLPQEFRETVVLCELEELSYEETARLLDCPIGTVRSRLHRARALLLAKLEMWRNSPRQAAASGAGAGLGAAIAKGPRKSLR